MAGIKKRLGSLLGPSGKDGTTPEFVEGTTTQLSPSEPAKVELTKIGDAEYRVDAQVPRGLDGDPTAVANFGEAMAAEVNTTDAVGRVAVEKLSLATNAGGPLASLDKSGGALKILYRALALRNEQPCRIVFTGSSTTSGYNATEPERSYPHLLTQRIQEAYPSIIGTETPVEGWTPTLMPGVQGVNLGVGGAQSSGYINEGRLNLIEPLDPAMVMHMVGSNDWTNFIPPETYKTQILDALDQLRARIPGPCVHVYVHQHERVQSGGQGPFSVYRDVLREVALENPHDVVLIDLEEPWKKLGVPAPDPYGLLDTDNIHLTDRGHAVLAEMLAEKLGIPQGAPQIGDPIPTEWETYTSDTFTGSGDAGGRPTDAALGGTSVTPTHFNDAPQFIVGNETLSIGGFNYLDYPETIRDARISFTLDDTGNTDTAGWGVYLRRVDSKNGIYLRFRDTGRAQLQIANDYTEKVFGPTVDFSAGDRFTLTAHDPLITVERNGEVVTGAIASGMQPGIIRLRSGSATSGVQIKDLIIDTPRND